MRALAGAGPSLAGALCIALVACAGQPTGAESRVLTAPLFEHQLGNGLQVVVVPWDSPGVMAYATLVRTGSRDEVEPGRSGYAHLFEHMMFRGTPRHSEGDYARILRQLGAEDNATTNDDRTLYTILAPATALETIMDLEADRFQNLSYTEEVFRTEAGAVLGEAHTLSSQPQIALLERLREVAFDHHPYEHTTLGLVEDIRAMTEGFEYSRNFFHRFYRPENTIVIVVGDVVPEIVFALTERFYGSWERGYQTPAVVQEPAQTATRRETLRWRGPTAPWLAVGYRAPAFTTASVDTAAIDVLASLLFGEASPLYQDLVVNRRLADVIAGALTDHRDPYLFEILIRASDERHLPAIEGALAEAMEQLREHPVEKELLEAVKSHLRYEFALELDSPLHVAEDLAHYIALTGSSSTVHEVFARYAQVTPADVQRMARELFRSPSATTVLLIPGDDRTAAPEAEP